MNFVAFSGGKDSTALVLRMAELGETFECVFTPTGNELSELTAHMERVLALAGNPRLHIPKGPQLEPLIEEFEALPNHRQRWCTRLIKIVPCIAFLRAQVNPVLVVGLRADEEDREGLYGPYATYRYPMREWGWKLADVRAYVKSRGVIIPRRTDCALCYGQRLGEWYRLWRDHPERFAEGVAFEARTKHTFRSPSRDTWPAPLAELAKRFEAGEKPRRNRFGDLDDEQNENACRVCSL